MKGKTVLIVLVAVLATAASTYVATRAITGTVTGGHNVSASTEAGPGEIETKCNEVALLVGDIEESSGQEAVTSGDRDPMVTYQAKTKSKPTSVSTSTAPRVPRWPSYTVTAILIGDDDPRAFLTRGSQNLTIRVGDEIAGGRVTAIEPDGVTIVGEAGTKKYPF